MYNHTPKNEQLGLKWIDQILRKTGNMDNLLEFWFIWQRIHELMLNMQYIKRQGLPTDLSTLILWQSSIYYNIWRTQRIWACFCILMEISCYHAM